MLLIVAEQSAEALPSPYRVTVDLGPNVVQHKIVVTALTPDKKRVQWQQTINKGHLSLSVKLHAVEDRVRGWIPKRGAL